MSNRTSTLIDVVAKIDARIKMYKKADANDPFYQGAIASLTSLSEELQDQIISDISTMENSTN
jgi:hypothetical protein